MLRVDLPKAAEWTDYDTNNFVHNSNWERSYISNWERSYITASAMLSIAEVTQDQAKTVCV